MSVARRFIPGTRAAVDESTMLADPSGALFRGLFESARDAMVIVDATGAIVIVNAQAEKLFGYPREELVGRPVEVLVPEHLRASQAHARPMGARLALRGRRQDGSEFPVEISVSPLETASGETLFASAIRDVSERLRFEHQLSHLAEHDPLTELFNRRRFFEELERALALSARYGQSLALLMVDLDNFKYHNDTHGSRGGDELIRAVAGALRHRLRETDVLARLGGDEFAVVLPEADLRRAKVVADGLLDAVRTCDVSLDGRRLQLSASIGIAVSESSIDAEELLARAGFAMYAVKDRGRDGVAVYSSATRQRLTSRLDCEERIRRALSEDAFELVLQPIVSLGSGAVEQGELLLRMVGDDGHPIMPASFLDVAERTGLIRDIDRWVARRAIQLLAAGGRALPVRKVEVNVSARSLDDTDFPSFVEHELGRAQVDPARLVFEITETAAVSNMDDAMRFAGRLVRAGCGFALDDFGTGFGSFYYLKHLPVDYVKIDGDFIRELPATRSDQLMVRAITQVAQGLEMKTVAEWVADEPTMVLLREYGIDYAQGYHVGRPQSVGPAMPRLVVP